MADYVWLSKLEVMDNKFRYYVSTATEGLQAQQGVAGQLNWQGDVVPHKAIPKALRPERSKPGVLDELNMLANKFFVIGRKTSEVISQFDLGAGAMHPVAIEDRAGNLLSEDAFFFWNFGNKQSHFRPDHSSGVAKSNYGHEKPGQHFYFIKGITQDDAIAFSKDCLDGPDAWCEQYLGPGTIMSDRLVSALRDAGLDKAFEFKRCRLI